MFWRTEFLSRLLLHCESRGDVGFDHPGRELMRHVRTLVPDDVDDEDWSQVCDQLDIALGNRDLRPALRWFLDYFPRCMALVPRRRRTRFLMGVLQMSPLRIK